MEIESLPRVMPVPGLDPEIVAGIHVFLAAPSLPSPLAGERRGQAWMAGTSPAKTPESGST
jgi:hypothetical protein